MTRESIPQSVSEEQWPELIDWLDEGLRRGFRGRLQAEYPVSLEGQHCPRHRVIFSGGSPRAHAMFHVVTVDVHGAQIEMGLIGLVYTDPAARGQGFARSCVEACIQSLREAGIPLVGLWSDLEGFYEPMGFARAGTESLWVASRAQLSQPSGDLLVGADVRSEEWEALEGLYAEKAVKVVRETGSLQRLASGPDVEVRVARQEGLPVAYAALGRGDDFEDVVHEWAGSSSGVSACLSDFMETRGLLGLMAGPEEPPWLDALRRAGAKEHRQHFAFLQVLDAARVFSAIASDVPDLEDIGVRQQEDVVYWEGAKGTAELDRVDTTRLLFGTQERATRLPVELAAALSGVQHLALDKSLPWPLYLWGFDGI